MCNVQDVAPHTGREDIMITAIATNIKPLWGQINSIFSPMIRDSICMLFSTPFAYFGRN